MIAGPDFSALWADAAPCYPWPDWYVEIQRAWLSADAFIAWQFAEPTTTRQFTLADLCHDSFHPDATPENRRCS